MQPALSEAQVVRRHLEEQCGKRNDRDRGKGVFLPRLSPRPGEGREEPRDAEDERQDPESEAERCEVLE